MTIIAGFRCRDGIVVCADTQETMGDAKKSVPKVQVHTGPYGNSQGELVNSDLAVAFAGAGLGPFVDKIVDRAWRSAREASDIYLACDLIETAIKETYEEFGRIYQAGQCPEADLVYGITMNGMSRLFHAYGPLVNEKEYVSAGKGYYLADFIAGRMYGGHLTTRQCTILAAYILFEAKENVDGCGGESHIAVLRETESSGLVEWKFVKEVTEYIQSADREAGELLLACANLTVDKQTVADEIDRLVSSMKSMRDHHIKEISEFREWFTAAWLGEPRNSDDLGLPRTTMPSDSETSEGQR